MKKLLIGIVAMLVTLGTTGCNTINNDSTSLKQKGLDIAATLDFLAEDKDYAKLFTTSNEIISIVTDIGKEDYSNPRAIFEIKGLSEAMMDQISGDFTLSQELKYIIENRFSAALSGQISAMNGTTYLAVTSILNYNESFIFSDITEPTTYLYLYDGDYSVIVDFNPFYDDVVSASGTIILNNSLVKAIETQDFTSTFKAIGVDGITITMIE